MTSNPVTADEREEILRLLTSGVPVQQIAKQVHRANSTIAAIRDSHGIWPVPVGRPGRGPVVEELDEEDGVGAPNAWTPPPGYDLFAERPNQRQWLAMLAAASRFELQNLRLAVCQVLGVTGYATAAHLDEVVIADRRTAEELAGAYLDARGGRRAA